MYTDCDESYRLQLNKGLNKRYFPTEVKDNSEVGVEFGYSAWQKTGERDEKDNWLYFQTSRLTTQVFIKIVNRIPGAKAMKVELKHRASQVINERVLYNDETPDNPLIMTQADVKLLPGDKLEIYIHPLIKTV